MLQRLSIVPVQVKTDNTWQLTQWNTSNNIFFVSNKRNY